MTLTVANDTAATITVGIMIQALRCTSVDYALLTMQAFNWRRYFRTDTLVHPRPCDDDHTSEAVANSPRRARAGWRHHPAHSRSRQRTGRARPPGRHRRRQSDRWPT